MNYFIAPFVIWMLATVLSQWIVRLKTTQRELPMTLSVGRYVAWIAFGVSASMASIKSGLLN